MLSQTLAPELPSYSMQSTSSSTGASNQEQQLRAQLELLKDHDAPSSLGSAFSLSAAAAAAARDLQRNAPQQPFASPRSSLNGYSDLAAVGTESSSSSASPRSLVPKSDVDADAHIHPELRARVNHQLPIATMMPIAAPSGHSPGASHSAPNIAPAPSQPGHEETMNDGRKAKRELSQSKRAAQNRAAQRAFRQRKEGYIKKLEQQVRDYEAMEPNIKAMRDQNYALRDYVIQLQARLLEVSGEVPQPPAHLDLSQQPGAPPPGPPPAPTNAPELAPPPPNAAVGTPLEAVAQAVAGLAAHEQMAERHSYTSQTFKAEPFKAEPGTSHTGPPTGTEDTRSAEEINRQLQQPEEAGPGSGV